LWLRGLEQANKSCFKSTLRIDSTGWFPDHMTWRSRPRYLSWEGASYLSRHPWSGALPTTRRCESHLRRKTIRQRNESLYFSRNCGLISILFFFFFSFLPSNPTLNSTVSAVTPITEKSRPCRQTVQQPSAETNPSHPQAWLSPRHTRSLIRMHILFPTRRQGFKRDTAPTSNPSGPSLLHQAASPLLSPPPPPARS
jgi:hypothetical protein